MSSSNDKKYLAMSNFASRLNAAIIEDIAPKNNEFENYNQLGLIYTRSERRNDFTVILQRRNGVPDSVVEIVENEAIKWANHFDVNVEFR